MPVIPYTPVAFRCKNCGRLHEAEHAGENDRPYACRVCGAGVIFQHAELTRQLKESLTNKDAPAGEALNIADQIARTPPGMKTLDPDNWEVLAEATPERLQELGLAPQHITQHAPRQKPAPDNDGWRPHHDVEATAQDAPNGQDQAG
jgi:DNA-directed RNA polymerase subunit RPC12/RpoP